MQIQHLLYVFPEPLPLPRARGVQVAHFVRALAMTGIRLTLAYVPGEAGHPFSPIGHEIPPNVTLLPLSRNFGCTPLKSHRLFMWRLERWLRQQIRGSNAPDIVFFRHIKAAAQFAKAFPDIPFIYEAHEVFAKTAKSSQQARLRTLESLVMQDAALLLANSAGTANSLAATYPLRQKVHILPNGVEYPDSLPAKPWSASQQQLVYAGSLFGWKGVDDLVDAMTLLPDFHLRIAGGNTEQIARLRARAGHHANRIEFLGQRPQHEVQGLLARSCVAILPNRPDPDSAFTSPLKLFEYMAAGCAIVATDLPAIREVLGNEGCAWAEPGDPTSLADAIRRLCARTDGGAALGEAGRQQAKNFTWFNRARQLAILIADATFRVVDKK